MSALVSPVPLMLRPMREHDLVQVMEVEQRAYEFPWTAGIFADCLRAAYSCWSLLEGECLLGYGIMTMALDEAHVLNLCVDPPRQQRGHAQQLLDHLVEVARGRGASRVFLEVRPSNLAARRLYARNGFVQIAVRRGYYPAQEGREDAWVLSRRLGLSAGAEARSTG